jgi:hypothetical protein
LANRPYLFGLYNFAEGNIAFLSDNIKVVLCSSGYTPNTAAAGDEYLNVIAGGNIVATSGNLASKTDSGGTLDAANLTFSSVSGSTVTQFAMYTDTGTSSTSPLMFLWDTATNLPVTPNGGNITIQWAGSPYYIATLCKGLSDEERAVVRRFGWRRLVDLIRGWGIPADQRTAGGIWIPAPSLVAG